MALRKQAAIPSLLAASFEVALALLLLFGWLIHRERKDLASLAALLTSEVVARAGEFASVAGDLPHSTGLLLALSITLSPMLLTYFTARTLNVRSRLLLWAAGVPFLIQVWQCLMIAAAGRIEPGRFDVYWTGPCIVLMAAVALLSLRSLHHAVKRAAWSEITLPAGLLVIALLMGQRADFQSSFLRGNPNFIWAGMLVRPLDYLMMFAALMVTVHLLRGLSAARQRLSGEMEAARAVQQLLLTATDATGSDFVIETEYLPAQEVGGDFYYVLAPESDSRMVVLGDVSGKGLKAAMVVSVAVGILRTQKSKSPGEILAALNDGLAGQLGGAFVTCSCACFGPGGSATMASAGHPAPYCDGRELQMEAGLPLGIVPGVKYAESVAKGSWFTFVSDGVVEAANAKGELFGFERTREISGKSAREIAGAAKAWGQNDDITVVTVRRNA